MKSKNERINKCRISDFTRQRLKDLAPLFSKRFSLDLDTIYEDKNNLTFFIKLIKKRKHFDIEQIKLDIINGVDLENLAVEYREPLYVIEEVNKNIETVDYKIVASKIYSRQELDVLFNRRMDISIERVKLLNSISYNPHKKHRSVLMWLGQDLINNYNELIMTFDTDNENIQNNGKLIKLTTAAKLLGLPSLMLHLYVKEKKELFGVVLNSAINDSSRVAVYLEEKEVMHIKSQLKFYITTKEMDNKIINKNNKFLITSFIKNITEKTIDLRCKYIKKEDANYILEIDKLMVSDIVKYRTFLMENIKNSIYDNFKLRLITTLLYRGNYPTAYNKWIKKFNETISKKEALFIINEVIGNKEVVSMADNKLNIE